MGVLLVIDRYFKRVDQMYYSAWLLIFSPMIINGVRTIQELALSGTGGPNPYQFRNALLFYLVGLMLLSSVMALASGHHFQRLVKPVSIGLIFGWLPPLFDLFLPAKEGMQYIYFQEFTWTLLSDKQLPGESIALWIGILASTLWVGWLSRSVWRTLVGFVGVYGVFQVTTWLFWALAEPIHQQTGIRRTEVMDFMGLLTVLAVYAAWHWSSMGPSVKRLFHALPFGLLAAIGSRMAGEPWIIAGSKGVIIAFITLLLVIANDYFEREDDARHGGSARPVSKNDIVFVHYLQVLSAFWVIGFNPRGFYLVLLYMLLALAYHHPETRFKRLFCLGYKLEGLGAACCFLFGVTRPIPGSEHPWVIVIATLVLGGFALGSMFKDYKDIEQDRAAKIGTVYTRYLKQGKSLKGIHAFVSYSMLAMLLVPPVWLAVIEQPLWQSLLMAGLAALPTMSLQLAPSPRKAVTGALMALTIYLAVFLPLAPIMNGG